MRTAERAQRPAPHLTAVDTVGGESEVGKEHVERFAVGDGSGYGGVVQGSALVDTRALQLAGPKRLSGGAVERRGQQPVSLVGGVEEAAAGQHRRRFAQRRGMLPDEAGVGAHFERGRRAVTYAVGVGAPEASPVGSCGVWECDGQGSEQGRNDPGARAALLFFSLFQWILPNYSMNSSGRCSNWFTIAGEN